MKGFKNTTKTQYFKSGSDHGYAKGGSVKGAAKISKVMGEFKHGELHSGSKKGPKVTNPKQATAIALSEARKAGAKIPQPVQKKGLGGILKAVAPIGEALLESGMVGGIIGGPLIAALLKKKQSGVKLNPTEEKQLANAKASAPATMKRGGKVMKKDAGGAVARGNRMQALEAKEEKKMIEEGRKRAAEDMRRDAEKERRQRSLPSSASDRAVAVRNAIEQARAAKGTGGREEALRIVRQAGEGVKLGMAAAGFPSASGARKVAAPVSRAPAQRGPAGAGYQNNPMIPDVIEGALRRRGIIGRKGGGLAAMPKGKKR